jgi:GntR family transcriptional regulator
MNEHGEMKSARLAPLQSVGAVELRSTTPLYQQIFEVLRDKIYGGEYEIDSFLPSEQEIAEFFRVSRITAKRALDEMANAGLAVRLHGRGTRVCITPRRTRVHGDVSSLVHSLHAKGPAVVRVLEFEYRAAPVDVAERLQLSPGDEIQYAVRVWSASDGPFSHLTTFVPALLGRHWSRSDLEARPLVSLLEESGIKIRGAEESITATLADGPLAAALSVQHGSALLKIMRTVYGEGNKPVEYVISHYPPERYRYSVTLER